MSKFLERLKFDKIINISKYICLSIFGLIILYLLIMSVNSTAWITYQNPVEKVFYEHDNIIFHIVCFFIFTVALIFIKKVNFKIDIKKIYIILFIFLILFPLMSSFAPIYDQRDVLGSADSMYTHDFSPFEKGGYVGRFPHQKGLVLFIFLLQDIFGNYNYIAFQFINVFAFIIYFYCMINITNLLFSKDKLQKYSVLFLILFFPIAIYVTFVYGTILGLAFSLLSILYILKYYIENKKTTNIVISSISISLAIMFKQNCLIYLVAIIIYIFFNFLKTKKLVSLLIILFFILTQTVSSFCVDKFISNYTGVEDVEGLPTSSWIAMGLQEGPDAPGWFNMYNTSTFQKNDYNAEVTNEIAIENIKETIQKFKDDPEYAIDFFSIKTNSQWNNPTFGCFWIGQACATANNQTNFSYLINKIYFGKLNFILTNILNIVQTLILAGTILFVLFEYKNIKFEQLIFAIAFIGGFIFHMFWEAKGQYTIPYFTLLILYAVKGYNTLTNKLIIVGENYKNKKVMPKINKFYVVAFLIFIALTINSYKSLDTIFTEENETIYENHMNKLTKTNLISKGEYIITSNLNSNYYVYVEDLYSDNPIIRVSDNSDMPPEKFFLYPQKNIYKLRNITTKKMLDVTGGVDGEKKEVSLYDKNNSSAQDFKIMPCDDDSDCYYIIWNEDRAVTLDENTKTLYIDEFTENNNQKWKFAES